MDEKTILKIDKQGDVPNCSITEYGFTGEGRDLRFTLRRANYVPPELEATAVVTVAADAPVGPK